MMVWKILWNWGCAFNHKNLITTEMPLLSSMCAHYNNRWINNLIINYCVKGDCNEDWLFYVRNNSKPKQKAKKRASDNIMTAVCRQQLQHKKLKMKKVFCMMMCLFEKRKQGCPTRWQPPQHYNGTKTTMLCWWWLLKRGQCFNDQKRWTVSGVR